MIDDPTTAAIEAQNAERDQLRAENQRLQRALVAAYIEVEVMRAEPDRQIKRAEVMFVEGYDQAVGEIRDHFRNAKATDVVTEIEATWMKDKLS